MDSQELQALKNRYDIIGNDAGLNNALEIAVAVAPTDIAVLIDGESGTGKDIIPRIIHQHSRRKGGNYFAVNCGGIPEGTINSELFGHVKGAFTGADREHKGYFEEADGGTLFLDEIGELPAATQAMLLRVIQNGEYMKVGSAKVERTNVRVIAASNVNLAHAVSQGKFRSDLYYRLNGITIKMPALRERSTDIHLLFRKFSADFSERNHTHKVNLTHDAIRLISEYRWPGNIRQLKNFAEAVTALETQNFRPTDGRCEVDALTLRKYLPVEGETAITVTDPQQQERMSDNDRQMIFNAMLKMSRDIEELKRAVYGGAAPAVVHDTMSLPPAPADHAQTHIDEVDEQPQAIEEKPQVEESLDIVDNEKSLIEKALRKHDGHRKSAAAELGFSERTLYRKMEKYGLKS